MALSRILIRRECGVCKMEEWVEKSKPKGPGEELN